VLLDGEPRASCLLLAVAGGRSRIVLLPDWKTKSIARALCEPSSWHARHSSAVIGACGVLVLLRTIGHKSVGAGGSSFVGNLCR